MKTNFKLSSKMHIFIIISVVIIAIGTLVGTVCHFVAGGYFNGGEDYSNYKCVTVSYEYVDFSSQEEVEKMCLDAFSKAGIKQNSVQYGKTNTGGEVVYKFSASTDDTKLLNAEMLIKATIDDSFGTGITLSSGAVQNDKALFTGIKSLSRCAIAISVIAAAHFIYFLVRYKLSMALAALLADAHNLALFISLITLTRIPVGPSTFALAVLCTLLTVIGTCFLFDRVRKNIKNDDLKKLSAFELTDLSASESLKVNALVPACLAALCTLLFILLSISSLSPVVILSSVLGALVCLVSCAYGNLMFIPSVYSRFKLLGDGFNKNYARAQKEKAKN